MGRFGLQLTQQLSYPGGEKTGKSLVSVTAVDQKDKLNKFIDKQPLAKIDYIAVTDANTLEMMNKLRGEVLISLAVRFGKTRLIDNLKVKVV
jgi:pantothenate synthetase